MHPVECKTPPERPNMSKGTPTINFRSDPVITRKAAARAQREGTNLSNVLRAFLESYAAAEEDPEKEATP